MKNPTKNIGIEAKFVGGMKPGPRILIVSKWPRARQRSPQTKLLLWPSFSSQNAEKWRELERERVEEGDKGECEKCVFEKMKD